jgi:hypothetical protein
MVLQSSVNGWSNASINSSTVGVIFFDILPILNTSVSLAKKAHGCAEQLKYIR